MYTFVKTKGTPRSERELTVEFTKHVQDPLTITCEVDLLKEDASGQMAYVKESADVTVQMYEENGPIPIHNSQATFPSQSNKRTKMVVKQGPWHTPSSDQTSVSVGGPLDISCLYTTYVSTNVYPELSLTLNGRPWSAYSASARCVTLLQGMQLSIKIITQPLMLLMSLFQSWRGHFRHCSRNQGHQRSYW